METKYTVVSIPVPLHRDLKIISAELGVPMREIVGKVVSEYLNQAWVIETMAARTSHLEEVRTEWIDRWNWKK